MYIPRFFIQSEEAISRLAEAVIDLFEELDADSDGRITWPDFIAYYTEASQLSEPLQDVKPTPGIFKNVQKSGE